MDETPKPLRDLATELAFAYTRGVWEAEALSAKLTNLTDDEAVRECCWFIIIALNRKVRENG